MEYKDVKNIIESVDGHLMPGQEEWLFNVAKYRNNNKILLEIGCYKGRSTLALGLPLRNTSSVLFSVDIWEGRWGTFKTWKSNIKRNKLTNNVFPIKMNSHKALTGFENPFLDLVFIDGSHDYSSVSKDIELSLRLLKDGGILIVHDVWGGFPGVIKAWGEYKDSLKNRGKVDSISYGYR